MSIDCALHTYKHFKHYTIRLFRGKFIYPVDIDTNIIDTNIIDTGQLVIGFQL